MNRECALCGHSEVRDIRMGLVDWKDPLDGNHYAVLPRCRDKDACRARAVAQGDEWPLREGVRP